MATINWIGNAHATKQIDTITVAGTWQATDTVLMTMNGKDLTVTIVNGTTMAQVAASIRNAWNAAARLDGQADTTNTNTSNFGGQEHGEFSEATAYIYDASPTVVQIIANRAGVPFTLSVTEATIGDGTATEATPQAATGPNHWNNGDNWSAGAAPVSDDVVVFKNNDVSVKYGLPNATMEVTIEQWQSYTGQIGLPEINRDNASKPYYEYRQRYVRLDDAGSSVTNIPHRFGMGNTGTGSPLINLKHSTLKITPCVFNTGTPQIQGTKALNIVATAVTSTINILAGSVNFGSQDGSTSAFVAVTQSGGDSVGIIGIHTTAAVVTMSGGTMLVGGTGAIATVDVYGGTLRFEGQTGTIASLDAFSGGTIEYASTATITALGLGGAGATFDARINAGAFIITDSTVFDGSRFLDPYRRVTFTNKMQFYGDPGPNLQFGGALSTRVYITTTA